MRHKKFLKNTFWAHKGNDYRPHFVRGRFLLVLVLLLVVVYLVITYIHLSPKQTNSNSESITTSSLLDRTNAARVQDQKPVLQKSLELTRAADQKVQDMIKGGYWAHVSPGGTQPWFWLEKNNYAYVLAGENLAKGYNNVDEVIQAWLESPDHRDNMLNDRFTQAGFAVSYGTFGEMTGTIVVAFYGLPQLTQGGSVSGGASVFSTPRPLSATIPRTGASFVLILALLIAFVVLIVIILAHIRHSRLPKNLRTRWHRHYVIYTTTLTVTAISFLVWALRTVV